MQRSLWRFALMLGSAGFFGCETSTHTDNLPSPEVNGGTGTMVEPIEIVFRGRYFMSKECITHGEGKNRSYAMTIIATFVVDTVLIGNLPMVKLICTAIPEGTKEGETYTFRWKVSPSMHHQLERAKANESQRIWISGEQLELVKNPDQTKQ